MNEKYNVLLDNRSIRENRQAEAIKKKLAQLYHKSLDQIEKQLSSDKVFFIKRDISRVESIKLKKSIEEKLGVLCVIQAIDSEAQMSMASSVEAGTIDQDKEIIEKVSDGYDKTSEKFSEFSEVVKKRIENFDQEKLKKDAGKVVGYMVDKTKELAGKVEKIDKEEFKKDAGKVADYLVDKTKKVSRRVEGFANEKKVTGLLPSKVVTGNFKRYAKLFLIIFAIWVTANFIFGTDKSQEKSFSPSNGVANKKIKEKARIPVKEIKLAVNVNEKKPDGSSWDTFGSPNVVGQITITPYRKLIQPLTVKFEGDKAKVFLSAGLKAYSRNAEIEYVFSELRVGDSVSLVLEDEDKLINDSIGQVSFIYGGEKEKRIKVESAVVSIKFLGAMRERTQHPLPPLPQAQATFEKKWDKNSQEFQAEVNNEITSLQNEITRADREIKKQMTTIVNDFQKEELQRSHVKRKNELQKKISQINTHGPESYYRSADRMSNDPLVISDWVGRASSINEISGNSKMVCLNVTTSLSFYTLCSDHEELKDRLRFVNGGLGDGDIVVMSGYIQEPAGDFKDASQKSSWLGLLTSFSCLNEGAVEKQLQDLSAPTDKEITDAYTVYESLALPIKDRKSQEEYVNNLTNYNNNRKKIVDQHETLAKISQKTSRRINTLLDGIELNRFTPRLSGLFFLPDGVGKHSGSYFQELQSYSPLSWSGKVVGVTKFQVPENVTRFNAEGAAELGTNLLIGALLGGVGGAAVFADGSGSLTKTEVVHVDRYFIELRQYGQRWNVFFSEDFIPVARKLQKDDQLYFSGKIFDPDEKSLAKQDPKIKKLYDKQSIYILAKRIWI